MLAESQNLLVLLLCDRRFRQTFTESPEKVLQEFSLTEEEKHSIKALSAEALERYALGLLEKRWRSVKDILSTSTVLWPQLESIYKDWLAEHPAPMSETELSFGQAEALRALPPLRKELASPDFPEFAGDVVSYEILQQCSRNDGKSRRLRSEWWLRDWWELPLEEQQEIEPPHEPTEYLFESNRCRWRTWEKTN